MKTLLVMAGGTGGHVFPALAVAQYLRDRGVRIVWLGTRLGLESRVVPEAGFEMCWMSISGLRGKGLGRMISMPFLLIRALIQGLIVMFKIRPDALLGMGGFAAGPGAVSGWLMRKPLVIHEANASAGLTNRLLTPLARRILTGFPKTKGLPERTEWTGNPLRNQIEKTDAIDKTGAKRLLIVGGSLGARVFNQNLPEFFKDCMNQQGWEVWHQCGIGNKEAVVEAYKSAGINARVDEFIDDMGNAYVWANLVLCRAGAMTVAEICMAGLPAIYVPFPHAAGDHQTINASYAVNQGAARLIPQQDFTAQKLKDTLQELEQVDLLASMSRSAKTLARPDATAVVSNICQEVMNA